MFYKLPVSKVMSLGPMSVSVSTSVKDASDKMREKGINSLLIKDGDEFVGIVTDVDIVKKGFAQDKDVSELQVGSIMTSPILSVDLDDSIDMAGDMMSQHHVRHLLVNRNGVPVGVVSARDLLDPAYEEEGGIPFWPNHLLKEVIAVFVMLGILFTLIQVSPAPMEPKADLFTTPEHIKPEWYFLAAYQMLKVAELLSFISDDAPKVIGVLSQGFIVVLLFALPFIDKNKERNPKKRKFAISCGITALVTFIIFTIWGHYS